MTETLRRHIEKLLPGQDLPWDVLHSYFQITSVKKGAVLLQEQEPCQSIYFVNSGCLYLYYTGAERREVVHFALEQWWITDYKTFSEGKPAVYAIAAMEDTELCYMHRTAYEQLQLQVPAMALYFNKIHEKAYGAALLKQKTYATVTSAGFYHYFRTTYPILIERIPDDIFAAYMGVSMDQLQEIKAAFVS